LLAWPKALGVPVAVGEILVGVAFGVSGLNIIDVKEPTTVLISQIGFALVMMLVGSQIKVKETFSSKQFFLAARNIAIATVFALVSAWAIVQITGHEHLAIYALIMASSSAAVVLPLLSGKESSKGQTKPSKNLALLVTQVAVADLLGILALPAVMAPSKTPTILIGASAVTACAFVLYFLLRAGERNGVWSKFRKFSRERRFGLELRISLLALFGLATLAQSFGVSVMIAGFALGLAIAANGVPHRLAKQLFAVTEGLFAPVFYVLLGASIDFRRVFVEPNLVVLSLMLVVLGIASHMSGTIFGQQFDEAALTAASLGIPTAIVSIGLTTNAINSGEAAAITLAMLLSVIASSIFARRI
jgi:Kef-type K+ transport system membrane component KefB